MQSLYSDQSYDAVHRKLNRRLVLLAVIAVPLLALFIAAMILRIQWLAMVAACLAGCFAVFYVEMFCLPLARYRRLIGTALHGRSHTQTLEFSRVDPDLSAVDGIPCRSLIFLGTPDKHGTREQMLYWDDEIPLPDFQPGQEITIQYTDRNIIGFTPATPSSRL